MTNIAIQNDTELAELVRGRTEPLEIVGAGTKRDFGRSSEIANVLDVSALRGIMTYEPDELVITARAATPVSEIEAALSQKHQRLGFDPADWGPLFGMGANAGTIGGALSADTSGSARVRFGGARDHLLGYRAVNGFGEAYKAGGKVVKNVTGFDLPKLMCGAMGTLGVLTEVTLRLVPAAPCMTLAVKNISADEGFALLRRAWSSPLEATGLVYIPDCARGAFVELGAIGEGAALIRLEGTPMPLKEKIAMLRTLANKSEALEIENGDAMFRKIGAGATFVAHDFDVWRIAVPPSQAANVAHALAGTLWLADWAGGLFWIGISQTDETLAAKIRQIAVRAEGHARLMRASPETRARIAVFRPEDPARESSHPRGESRLRSPRLVQSRPHGGGRVMRTNFSLAQLAQPHLAEAEENLRACIHCGICTATCPTYVLLGDERDSPRGRIVMMQRMLEQGGAPSPETVFHIDRCLSCLACRTACPSSVDYACLVDTARAHIETHHRRKPLEKALRWAIVNVLTRPNHARAAIALSQRFASVAKFLPGRMGAMARKGTAVTLRKPAIVQPVEKASRRVALMPGCVQAALAPEIDEAAARVLARRGIALVPLAKAGCCGALPFHLGQTADAKAWAERAIAAFEAAGEFDAILISATGCGAHLKDYAHLLSNEPEWAARAKNFADKVQDFSVLATPHEITPPRRLRAAYQIACSLQHGLRLSGQGEALIAAAGHEVLAIPEGHLCCGSAGSYSLLQPELSARLRERKLANIATLDCEIIVSGNIGCITHLAGEDAPPIIHLAELIDWSEGGPEPMALKQIPR